MSKFTDYISKWNPLYIVGSMATAGGVTYAVFKMIQKNAKDKEADKNPPHTGDPNQYWESQGKTKIEPDAVWDPGIKISNHDIPAGTFTILNDDGTLNTNGISIANGLDKELHSPVWVDGSTVKDYVKRLATRGDWVALNNYWNVSVKPVENDTLGLMDLINDHVSGSNYTDIKDFVNGLPAKV